MIISASRRTDIPAFYWEWFQKRLQEQYVLVRNPLNLHQVSRISLRPEVVDGLVFWTKNPEPMLKQLSVLDAYAYYFQFTLNAYAADVEAALPPLAVRIEIFRQLAQKIGYGKKLAGAAVTAGRAFLNIGFVVRQPVLIF